MKFIKAIERLPNDEWAKFCKIGTVMGVCFYIKAEGIWIDEIGIKYKSEHIQWLDESYIQEGEERMFSLKEALEIHTAGVVEGNRQAYGKPCIDQRQYFQDKFGINL